MNYESFFMYDIKRMKKDLCYQCEHNLTKEYFMDIYRCNICDRAAFEINEFENIIQETIEFLQDYELHKSMELRMRKELIHAKNFINQIKRGKKVYYQNKKTNVLLDCGEKLNEITEVLKKRIRNIRVYRGNPLPPYSI